MRVRNTAGAVIHDAPVAYAVVSGTGHLSEKNDGTTPLVNGLMVSTNLNGLAGASFKVGNEVASASVITATAGPTGQSSSVTFTATVGDAGAAPVAPSDGRCTRQSPTSVLVEWLDNSDNETAFYVMRSLDNQTWEQIATLSANRTSFLDTSAPEANGSFIYGVTAHNEAPE